MFAQLPHEFWSKCLLNAVLFARQRSGYRYPQNMRFGVAYGIVDEVSKTAKRAQQQSLTSTQQIVRLGWQIVDKSRDKAINRSSLWTRNRLVQISYFDAVSGMPKSYLFAN